MSRHGLGVPPEVQEQANAFALELWMSIEKDAAREGIEPDDLAAVKPLVLQALESAFSRGSLIAVKTGLEFLQKAARLD